MPNHGYTVRHLFCRWYRQAPHRSARCPEPLAAWVVRTGSLTTALRRRYGAGFGVRLIDEGWRIPYLDEARRLELRPGRKAWVREVALYGGERPVIRARSVIPMRSLRGGNRGLTRLGTRPLGELLFAGAGTLREPLEIARLRDEDWLTRRLAADAVSFGRSLWARRTVHRLNGRPLLVAEVFLPDLLEDWDG
nr:chorismate lyase [Natronocella acetinitrilica]